MDIRYEAMAAQARDTLNALLTGVQRGTSDVRTTLWRAALSAIHDARASLDRWEPIVASRATKDSKTTDGRDPLGSIEQTPATDPSAAPPPPPAARGPEHSNEQAASAAPS